MFDERYLRRCVARGTYGCVWWETPTEVPIERGVWQEIPMEVCDENLQLQLSENKSELPNSKLRLWVGCREKFRSCPRLSQEEQTLEKGRCFHLHKEGNTPALVSAGEHTFSSGEKANNSLPVWINQSYEPNNRFSKQGALPGLWLSEEENARKNRHILWKTSPSFQWDGGFCYIFTPSWLCGSNLFLK